MKTTLDQLLTNIYELEGLLLVMKRRNDNIPELVIDRFKEKANEIAAVANVMGTQKTPDDSSQVVPPAFVPPEHSEVAQPAPPEKPVSAPKPIVEPVADNSNKNPSEPVAADNRIEHHKATLKPEPSSAHDITASFSINDRFLFQRELFDGNQRQYDDAIGEMQRLADIDKIKEFITNNLGMDSGNDVVKEFVRLIELSFKG